MGVEACRILSGGVPLDSVKRWDVYDVADELADVPGMLDRCQVTEAIDLIRDLERRLWAASLRDGQVGPWPDYDGDN